ncbi:D-alanyl-D-alanine carboxypeptidase family protein, partial [bacterium]|nr:D-alanyl-D-alanine carboxypeptidase family protein [bacterium]
MKTQSDKATKMPLKVLFTHRKQVILFFIALITVGCANNRGLLTRRDRIEKAFGYSKSSSFSKTVLFQGKHDTAKETERLHLEDLFGKSRNLIQILPISAEMQRLSWKTLYYLINETGKSGGFSKSDIKATIKWAEYLERNSNQLEELYDFPFKRQSVPDQNVTRYIKINDVLIPPGMASMWNHCEKVLLKQFPKWKPKLISGYHSPAYQSYLLSKSSGTLKNALFKTELPFYSRHQLDIPDISVDLIPLKENSAEKPWKQLHQICQEYGFLPSYPDHSHLQGELKFPGIKTLYDQVFASDLIKNTISRDYFEATKNTGFYLSPKGLRILFALSAQESTIQWNPKFNKEKKKLIKEKFLRVLSRIKGVFSGSVSNLLLSKNDQLQLASLTLDLERITDLDNDKVHEYDFYLWTRDVHEFIARLLIEHKQAAQFGQWFFELKSFQEQIEFEPQTFGLWQINVNHLRERIESFTQLRRVFPEIYLKVDGKWRVSRERLINALSGVPSSKLSHERTLELIIYTYLRPRYQNHMLGDNDDLDYFIAENMSGNMSTFRAAIQLELNNKIGSILICDGDLAFYYPYSTKINWFRNSKTYDELLRFIQKHQYYFKEPVNPERLIRQLCMADTWEELRDLELYKKIMGKKA